MSETKSETKPVSDYDKARDERTITRTIWNGCIAAVAFATVVGYIFTLVD